MNKRIQNSEDFLKKMHIIALCNPTLEITKELVYSNLIYDGKKDKIDGFFDYWINNFKGKNNIKVFRTEKFKYFCQFKNEKNDITNKDHIKMYLSYNKEYIYQNASIIFEFLDSYDIPHVSKISSHTRKDSIVIRLGNSFDAKLLANFINSTPVLQKGRNENTPFTFNENNIAYATDYHMSFNSVSSELISKYITTKRNAKDATEPSVAEFQSFIYKEIQIFKQSSNLEANEKLNKLEIMQLLINFLNTDYNLENYFDDYNKREYSKNNANVSQSNNETINNEEKNQFLKSYSIIVMTMISKYGYTHTCNAFRDFMESGQTKKFTRDNNVRAIMSNVNNTTFKNNFMQLLNNDIPYFLNETLEMNSDTIKKSLFETEKKYNEKQSVVALKKLITENNLNSFTNDNGARISLQELKFNRQSLNVIISYLKNENLDNILDYTNSGDINDIFNILSQNNRKMHI